MPVGEESELLAELRSSPGLLLAVLGHHAMRRLREAHTGQELSPRQFQLLGLLDADGPVAQQDLVHAMKIDPSILVTLMNPLEADGLLCRAREPVDRRRHLVSLTAKGRRRLIAAARAQREADEQLFAALDDEQREQLRELLITLKESLSGECPAAQCSE